MTTQQILEAARAAKSALALASGGTRQQALLGMADALCDPDQIREILAANAQDMEAAKGHITDVMLENAKNMNDAREPFPCGRGCDAE